MLITQVLDEEKKNDDYFLKSDENQNSDLQNKRLVFNEETHFL